MGIKTIEIKSDVSIYSFPFEDLVFDASHDVMHKSFGKKKIFVVPNKYGIVKKEDLLTWRNPRLNRYEKIIRMHNAGKWQQVQLPKRKPISGKELYVYVDFLEMNYNLLFVFVNEVKKS